MPELLQSRKIEYADHIQTRREVAEIIRPPKKISVSEAAEKYLYVAQDGVYSLWDKNLTPYLVDPMNCFNSRLYRAVIVVGPARSGKTIMILGCVSYVAKVDPADMMIIHTDKNLARKFSKQDLDRCIQNSPELAAALSTKAADDNVFDKTWKSGKMLSIGWPTVSQLSSHTTKYMMATDYDRRTKDGIGEGDLLGMMMKRHETFMSAGTSLIETSPGFPIKEPQWKPSTAHEAPPCDGALSFYNQGDRRRFYWQCLHCQEWFRANYEYLTYDRSEVDPTKAALTALMQCPHCNKTIEPKHKRLMNINGKWLMDGQEITKDGAIIGEGNGSNIASFWFEGPVACFQTWQGLLLAELRAEQEYEATRSEEMLLRTVTQDQGRPYLFKSSEDNRSHDDLMERREEYGYRVVPSGVRYLMASVDIQARSFVVQVQGFGIGQECWHIDRFSIEMSQRKNEDGEYLPIRPASYQEDWRLLVPRVLKRAYALSDGSGRYMKIKGLGIDSQGKAGTTEKAYKFYRYLKKQQLAANVRFLRGPAPLNAPRFRLTHPDSERRDRKAGARGEIPVYILNSNLLKDAVEHDLAREEAGPGYVHFPEHYKDENFFKELLAENRGIDGKWKNEHGRRNETLDLSVYNLALCLIYKADKINWAKPPPWAKSWDNNTLVFDKKKLGASETPTVKSKSVSDSERRKRAARRLAGG